MHEYKKLYTPLQMIGLLSTTSGWKVAQLARKYETSTRSIYRHFDLLKECGFALEKDSADCYRILGADEIFQKHGIHFSLEESAIVKDALVAIHDSHPLRNKILSKLFALSELDATAEIIYDKLLGKKIALIGQAIREKQQVVLKNYHSLNSNTITDRIVEPVSFVQNLRYFAAFELATHEIRHFKPDRIGEVELLAIHHQHSHLHAASHPDAFGMASGPEMQVALLLSARAAHLLHEEFPAAAAGLEETTTNETCRWNGSVKGFEGIGRFILGLPGEVEVLAPKELVGYLQEKNREALKTKLV